jgi:hypothetical protein
MRGLVASGPTRIGKPGWRDAGLGKRRGRLLGGQGELGIRETETNLRNKISRGGFNGAFLVQCLVTIGVTSLRLED